MAQNWLILDVSSAPISNAAQFLDGTVSAPSNYKDPDKIAAYIAEKQAERLEMAATDLDLARITGVGFMVSTNTTDGLNGALTGGDLNIMLCRTGDDEAVALGRLQFLINSQRPCVTYGGFRFDLPLMMRRARYLGVPFPTVNLDRWKSPHLDLCDLLSDRDPSRRRPLGWYVKRLSMGLLKPLSGAQEALVDSTNDWDGLRTSLEHDVKAIHQLGNWLGVL